MTVVTTGTLWNPEHRQTIRIIRDQYRINRIVQNRLEPQGSLRFSRLCHHHVRSFLGHTSLLGHRIIHRFSHDLIMVSLLHHLFLTAYL